MPEIINSEMADKLDTLTAWLAQFSGSDAGSIHPVRCSLPGGDILGAQYDYHGQHRLQLPIAYDLFRKAVHPRNAGARKRKSIRTAFDVLLWGGTAYLAYHGPVDTYGRACGVREAGADPAIYPCGPVVGVFAWGGAEAIDAHEVRPYDRVTLTIAFI